MAQRSYLIPVSNELTELFLELLNTDHEEVIWDKIYNRTKHHQRALFYSNFFCNLIDDEKVEENGKELDYGLFTSMRPYFITETDESRANNIVDDLFRCTTDQEIVDIFRRQLDQVKPFVKEKNADIPPYQEDSEILIDIKDQISTLKKFLVALQNGTNVSIEVPKQTVTEAGMTISLNGETETIEIKSEDIPQTYGEFIGRAFGQLCGMCYPSWWLGRNYWFGLLMRGDLGLLSQIPYLGIRKQIAASSEHPANLFETAKVVGFEKGFNRDFPAYQLGYYFPAQNVDFIRDELTLNRHKFHDLSKMATGYPDADLKYCEQMVYESLGWAARNHLGLIEGDDLVGLMGYR